jgi:hypothetical protein
MSNLEPERLVLSDDEIALVIDALDSHEYWQLSDPTWRHSGAVILPSDDPDRWADRPEPSLDERAAIAEIERCRVLAERLQAR